MLDVVCIGEILVDMTPTKPGHYTNVPGFLKNFGGAPFNVAIGVSRLGRRSGAIAAVGSDPFGEFLIDTLRKNNVDTSHIVVKKARTTLAFITLYPSGERTFFFYRKPWTETADTLLSPEDIDPEYIAGAKILHTSGVALTHSPEREAVLKAIDIAKENSLIFVFDPNVRLDLWASLEDMKETYGEVFKLADAILFAKDEAELLFGEGDHRLIAHKVLKEYSEVKYVAIKLGAEGAYILSRDGLEAYAPTFKVKVVDTTGAGDAWAAAFEVGLLEGWSLEKICVFANATASIKCTGYGAVNKLPTRKQVENFLKERGSNIRL